MPCLTSFNTLKTLYSNPDLLHGFKCLKCFYSLECLSYSDPFPDTDVPCSPPCTSEGQPDSFTTSRSQVRQNVLRRDVIISPCRMLEFCQRAQVMTFTELSMRIHTCPGPSPAVSMGCICWSSTRSLACQRCSYTSEWPHYPQPSSLFSWA